jgi:hypothetical protein
VRQGGVLSPILFTLYVDDIIIKLQSSNLGCVFHGVYVGCIMYADDLVLLACSLATLQAMINICSNEVEYLDMRFNVLKSSVIRIGKRFKHNCVPLTVCNDSLQFVNEIKYLGVFIPTGIHFSFNINKLKTKFYAALNGILSKCRNNMNEMVTLRLLNAFCRPILLYGCDCIPLCKTFIDSLTHSWNRIYYKVFKVSDAENISVIQSFMNDTAISDDVCRRRKRFISRVKGSGNRIMCILSLAIVE